MSHLKKGVKAKRKTNPKGQKNRDLKHIHKVENRNQSPEQLGKFIITKASEQMGVLMIIAPFLREQNINDGITDMSKIDFNEINRLGGIIRDNATILKNGIDGMGVETQSIIDKLMTVKNETVENIKSLRADLDNWVKQYRKEVKGKVDLSVISQESARTRNSVQMEEANLELEVQTTILEISRLYQAWYGHFDTSLLSTFADLIVYLNTARPETNQIALPAMPTNVMKELEETENVN